MPDGGLPWGTELWSWKDNCDTGVFVIRQKEYYALTYLDQEFDGDWPPQVTLNGHVFSTQNGHDPSDLETIKRYNSGTFWRSYSPLKKVWVSALGEVKDDGTSAFEGSGKNADYTLRVTHEMEVEQ